MALSIEFLKEEFNKINDRHFNGELLTPRFKIIHSKSHLGLYQYRYNTFGYPKDKIFDISIICISDYYDRSDEEIINTLAHEMIHLYIRQNKLKDTRPHHGEIFYAVADRLNREGGFSISRTDSTEGCGLRFKKKNVKYHVAAFKTNDGRYFRFVMNENYVNNFLLSFKKYNDYYHDYVVFESDNDKEYANYRVCRKRISGRYISKEEFENIRKAA